MELTLLIPLHETVENMTAELLRFMSQMSGYRIFIDIDADCLTVTASA